MRDEDGATRSSEADMEGCAASVQRGAGPVRVADAERQLRTEGLAPRVWSNARGYRYGTHSHPYHKVLYCVSGSITFHTDRENVELGPGDRLDLGPGVGHAATVGPTGVECVEAARDD